MTQSLIRRAGIAVLLWLATAVATTQSASALTPDQTARLLSGLETDAFEDDEERRAYIKAFAKTADQGWQRYESRIGKTLTEWASKELQPAPGETIYYPFAGPDLVSVQLLYPDASRYILIALQKGGRLPRLDERNYASFKLFLRVFKRGWINFAKRGFFHTDHMKRDMADGSLLEGITPVLMGFASRLGYNIDKVEPIQIKADGSDVEVHPGDQTQRETWDSVRLTLSRRSDKRKVVVDYLFLDLSDGYLKQNEAARTWVQTISRHRVVTKAASHLMQKPFFSIVKDAILAYAPSIWQDETGIGYEDLLEGGFDVTLYGKFSRANKLWTEGVQRSLARAYKRRKDIKPLPFKVGYKKDAGSCVQIAVRKK